MTIQVSVNVFVSNTKSSSKGYKGDFVYQQTSPTDKLYVQEDGSMDLSDVSDEVQIAFVWSSPWVLIDDRILNAMWGGPLNANIWISEGENSTPNSGDAPPVDPGSGDFYAPTPPANQPQNLTVVDKNDDGKKYKYTLHCWVNDGTSDGTAIFDDPKVVNRSLD